MRSAGDTLGVSHPDTFIFDYLAPSYCHTIYHVYLCISVDSLGVSRQFCKSLVCGANHRVLSWVLFRTKENSAGAILFVIWLVFILLVEAAGSYDCVSYDPLAYNLQYF